MCLQRELYAENSKALLQYCKGLQLCSTYGACQKLQTTFLSATATSSTIVSSESYGPSGRAASMIAWTCWKAFSYS